MSATDNSKNKKKWLERVLRGISLAATILVETANREKKKEANKKYGGRNKK